MPDARDELLRTIHAMTAEYAPPQPAPDPAPVVTHYGPRSNFSRLGVNLDSSNSSSTFHLTIDAARQARPIGMHVGPLEQVVFVEQEAAHGRYTLYTERPVDVTAFNSGAAKVVDNLWVDVPPGQKQLFLRYSGHPGRVVLARPGYALDQCEWQIFTDAALAQIAPFGVLRCMDLLGTNASPVTTWASRLTHPTTSWTPEDCIALANVGGKDLWLCIPHQADDDYVVQLRTLVESTLRPDVNCYVEYSNEVWNSAPPFNVQRNYCLNRALLARAAGDATLPTNDTYALWCWYARRTVEIAKILGPRFRVVLAGQDANPHICKIQLGYIAQHLGAPKDFLYAYSSAPYFYVPKTELARTNLTAEEYVQFAAGAVDYNADKQALHRLMCNDAGLRYIAYEANSHDHESGSPQAVLDGQLLPAYEQVYRQWLQLRRRFFDELHLFAVSARRYWKHKNNNPADPQKSVQQFGVLGGTHQFNSPAYRAACASAPEWA
jgi:hypothetical protein